MNRIFTFFLSILTGPYQDNSQQRVTLPINSPTLEGIQPTTDPLALVSPQEQ